MSSSTFTNIFPHLEPHQQKQYRPPTPDLSYNSIAHLNKSKLKTIEAQYFQN